MIIFVSTAAHRHTSAVIEKNVPAFRRLAYPHLFFRRNLPVATYIFVDFDRLSFWELEVAAFYYRELKKAGCRVLNDPARVLQRQPLLEKLYHDGINSFQVWSAHEVDRVDRFPVFLRTAHAHRGPQTALLHDAAKLKETLEQLVELGFPLSDLLIVEYCAEPVREGLFRKPSVYRVGDRLIACPSIHQSHWLIRRGNANVATEEEYAEDLDRVRANPHGPFAMRVFGAAEIEFGRLDIGFFGGRPQAYEINTNPHIRLAEVDHHSAARVEAMRATDQGLIAAISALDTPTSRQKVRIGEMTTLKRMPWRGRWIATTWAP